MSFLEGSQEIKDFQCIFLRFRLFLKFNILITHPQFFYANFFHVFSELLSVIIDTKLKLMYINLT